MDSILESVLRSLYADNEKYGQDTQVLVSSDECLIFNHNGKLYSFVCGDEAMKRANASTN